MDGFEEPHWNLIQVLAWVWLGDRETVRIASDGVTDHGTFWMEHRVPPDGHLEIVETPCGPVTHLKLCIIGASKFGDAAPPIDTAEEQVLWALREGKLRAWGVGDGTGDLEEIDRVQWCRLVFHFDNDKPPYAAPKHSWQPQWRELRFTRNEVMRLWPDPLQTLLHSARQGEEQSLSQAEISVTRRGRPKGAGAFANEDEPLVLEMQKLIETGAAKSRTEAASKVVKRASGGGTEESKIKRLLKAYSAKFSESHR